MKGSLGWVIFVKLPARRRNPRLWRFLSPLAGQMDKLEKVIDIPGGSCKFAGNWIVVLLGAFTATIWGAGSRGPLLSLGRALTGATLVTKVPTGDRRGWDTVGSTETLTGALVTAPTAMEVLPTRAGRAPAGAPVRVPEELTPAGGTAPAGSVRPADIPQVDQWQLQRLRSGITRERRLDERQRTPAKFRLHSIARKRRSGRDTEVNDRRRLGSRHTRPRPSYGRLGPAGSNTCSAASSAALPRALPQPHASA